MIAAMRAFSPGLAMRGASRACARLGPVALAALVSSGCRPAAPAAPEAPESVVVPRATSTPATASQAAPAAVSGAAGQPAGADAAEAQWVGEELFPCASGTPQHADAAARFAALSSAIERAPLAPAPTALQGELRAMLAEECFKMTLADGPSRTLDFGSGLALRVFWKHGGESWARTYLDLGNPATTPVAWLPPTPRRALTLETAPGHPLTPLLCPADMAEKTGPGTCGHSAEGYRFRADRALVLRGQPVPSGDCAQAAEAAGPEGAYGAWRDCSGAHLPRHDALPYGAFRLPTEGWLLLSGRRGHHAACEEERAYDLSSGAAYIVKKCRSMVQGPPPALVTLAGRLPLDALREAAWMLLLSATADRRITPSGIGMYLPEGMTVRRRRPRVHGDHIVGGTRHSGQTTLRLAWVVPSGNKRGGGALVGQASGTFDWPDSPTPARAHAAELLRIAEAGLEVGCPPAALPARLDWDGAPPIDPTVTPPPLDEHGPLRDALQALRKTRICPGPRGAPAPPPSR
jgi:hypothetical protein